MAGWPVALKIGVNGVYIAALRHSAAGSAPCVLKWPMGSGRCASAGVSSTS